MKNPRTPATSGGAPERWHPRRSATAWRTKPLCDGPRIVVAAEDWLPGGPREEPHQDWRSTGNGLVRPLALGLHAQVGPHLLEGDLMLPAQYKPFQDLRRVRRRVGTEQGLRGEDALGISNQHPANEHGGLARAVPDRCLGGEFHRGVVPSYQATTALAQATLTGSSRALSGGRRAPFSGGRGRSDPADGVALARTGRRPNAIWR